MKILVELDVLEINYASGMKHKLSQHGKKNKFSLRKDCKSAECKAYSTYEIQVQWLDLC
jgi:hypothetical protein